MTHIIIGLLIVAAGAIIVIKAEWFYQTFGTIPSAEKYLGTEGGSRLGYKLIGILGCIIGFMVMTDMLGSLLWSLFGSLFAGLIRK